MRVRAAAPVSVALTLVTGAQLSAARPKQDSTVNEHRCAEARFCVHRVYAELSREAMRECVRVGRQHWTSTAQGVHERWSTVLAQRVDAKMCVWQLRDAGVGAELLAFCGQTLNTLVLPRNNIPAHIDHRSHYHLEHLIEAFELTFADLLMLGLRAEHLNDATHFPLVVLYDAPSVRFDAAALAQLLHERAQYDRFCAANANNAVLLRLNTPFWHSVLV